MKRSQLAHVLRAAADISGEKSFVIVGSQAVFWLVQSIRLISADNFDGRHIESLLRSHHAQR